MLLSNCGRKNKPDNSTGDSIAIQDSAGYQLKEPVTIQLTGSHSYKHEFTMSEIVEDINYIPLETTPDCLIGNRLSNPVFTKDYIFIKNNGILLQFDRNGKFIRNINKIGQGPGEGYLRCFDTDEKSRLIYIFDNWKLSVNIYDFDGNFLNTIKNPFSQEPDGNSPEQMSCDNKGNIVYTFSNSMGNMKYKYVVMDNKGNFIYKCNNYDLYDNKKRILRMSFYPSPLFYYNNTLYYNYKYNDTIFRINEDYSCSPAYIIRIPKRITLEENIKTGTDEIPYSELSGHFAHVGDREDRRYIYIYNEIYNKDNISLLYRYDKQKGELTENINPNLKNDWDGGMDIKLEPFSQTENVLIYMKQPFEMKEKLTDEHFTETNVKFPEKRDALRSIVNNALEDDNPILMIVKLK
jgi:hypothetical protein